jgi:hypothetical protein
MGFRTNIRIQTLLPSTQVTQAVGRQLNCYYCWKNLERLPSEGGSAKNRKELIFPLQLTIFESPVASLQ